MAKKTPVIKVCVKCGKTITGSGYTKSGDLYCCQVCCKKAKDGSVVCEFC